jgi:hypothetical protein
MCSGRIGDRDPGGLGLVPHHPAQAKRHEPTHPIGDEVLTHLEEWGYEHGGDGFGDLILGDEVLTHLEEWTCPDNGDTADPTGSVTHTGLPGIRLPTPSDQAHPLWDRDLDG